MSICIRKAVQRLRSLPVTYPQEICAMKHSAWIIIACLSVVGCGGVADVKGTVSYKGQLLKFGSVSAIPPGGLVVQGDIKEDGSYELKGVGLGEAKFMVYCQDPKFTKAVTDLADKSPKDGEGKDGGKGGRIAAGALTTGDAVKAIQQNPNLIPDKYSDQSKTTLKHTAVRGENVYNIVLE